MFGSIESNQAEYIVPVLKPKKLSMIPSPLFLKTQRINRLSLRAKQLHKDFDLEMTFQVIAKSQTIQLLENYDN